MKDFDIASIQTSCPSSFDDFLKDITQNPPKAPMRKKLANLGSLNEFLRISNEQLVHKSTRDLWALQKDAKGNFYVERLFEEGEPLQP